MSTAVASTPTPVETAPRLELNGPAPDFEANSTHGKIRLSEWNKDKWVIHRDPRDARTVFFQDPRTHAWHPLRSGGGAQHLLLVRRDRHRAAHFADDAGFDSGRAHTHRHVVDDLLDEVGDVDRPATERRPLRRLGAAPAPRAREHPPALSRTPTT